MLVVVAVVAVTWHDQGRHGQAHNPLLLLILLVATVAVGIVATRFTRRLERLRRAVDEVHLRDLTTRVSMNGHDAVSELAESFNRMAARLEDQEKVRRQFFADLSHEIRHPIAIMLGRLESIQDGVIPLTEQQILHLHDMVLGLKRLVTDMNDLALADVGQLSLHRQPVDMRDLFAQIHANLQPVAEHGGLEFTATVPKALPLVSADPDRLRQVLTNLVTNAFQQTPSGGRVSLTCQTTSHDMTLAVSDNGTGIDPDDLPHLFERFYRADKSRSRTQGGSGLGLSIVRSMVDLHGGSIEAQSTPGQGSRFLITLPLAP